MAFRPIATTRSATGVPTGRLAVWWLIVSEIVIFGGVLCSYIMHRIGHPEWAYQAEHTNLLAGSVNTFVLLSSSLSAVLAHNAAEMGDGKKAAKFFGLTILGGLCFLVIKSFEWAHEIGEGLVIQSSGFWAFYYTAAGIHACHVIVGMIVMGFVAYDGWHGKDLQRFEFAGIYWHFVDLVWIYLFPLLYIAS
jgi:heme/copper-type cytochrome/quinol oxidase subunit 3